MHSGLVIIFIGILNTKLWLKLITTTYIHGMNLSYWEFKQYFSNLDYCIVGAGIVGLTTAIYIKESQPKAKILILEKELFGAAASSKNAGFACFGSVGEISDDIKQVGEERALATIEKRWQGLQRLQKLLGKKQLGLKNKGGYELFSASDKTQYDYCQSLISELNNQLLYIGPRVFNITDPKKFGFKDMPYCIQNPYESQLDTAAMYFQLQAMAQRMGVQILRGFKLEAFENTNSHVALKIEQLGEVYCNKLLISNNAFARQLFPTLDVTAVRAQVLVTEVIPTLPFKGTFHYDAGYYYFRNINQRILIGGARNANFVGETSAVAEINSEIQHHIETLLFDKILGHKVNIEHRWAGIMGVGGSKEPIIKEISPRVFCGVRMGGMGVAIGTQVAYDLAQLAN